ncbi:TonB-dependent receptor (plasmid) [Fulvitalea axinellae]|uniref:TonB-dependent receptor n=1 Tax=Fulvitalea axinellae TaxID=1182444 RepID=A0AAU9DK57_9BACT|nr:TonB-dependent receptor [Fulvitalea axinellae]
MNRRLIFFVLLFTVSWMSPAFSQKPIIVGTVLTEKEKQPIAYASVVALDKETGKIVSGITTDDTGKFSLPIPKESFWIEVRFMGFLTWKYKDTVLGKNIDLGKIYLKEDAQVLDGVVVKGAKSETVFKLDRRVFNVGADLSNSGASALEVLDKVPSVDVNIKGEISLRGSTGVNMLINGKPSVLAKGDGNALGTITADMIERVEVITNPSAKYEAEGTSGIINIILKKEEKKGLNGSVTVNTGAPQNHSLGVSLNKRTEKFNLFSQMGIGKRTMPEDFESINRDLKTGNEVSNYGDREKNEAFYNLILGTDYHINRYNVLTLSGHFAYEDEDEYSNLYYRQRNKEGGLLREWYRREDTEAVNPKYQYELQYKKSFKRDEEQSLIFSALGDFFGKDQSSVFKEDGSEKQKTETDFAEAEYVFNLDYTHPFSKKIKTEFGAQYKINDVTNDYSVENKNADNWDNDATLTNVFDYLQNVFGLYMTGAYEGDKWGLKAGLRMENTDLDTKLQNTGEKNGQRYTDFFPSVHTSYKFNDDYSVQAGYSRRIKRPNLWSLNPFTRLRDNYNISTGNPELQPEYTDSYEVSNLFKHGDLSLSFSTYFRLTEDVMERVYTFDNNVSVSRPENIGTSETFGMELNFEYLPLKWLSLSGDVNYNYFNRNGNWTTERSGNSVTQDFDFNSDFWSARLKSKLRLPADIDVEISGRYRSSQRNVQSVVSSNLTADLGLRKKLFKGKTVVNLSVRDVFASRRYESVTDNDDFYLYEYGKRGRFIILGLSYGFGKGEAMHFSGQKRF